MHQSCSGNLGLGEVLRLPVGHGALLLLAFEHIHLIGFVLAALKASGQCDMKFIFRFEDPCAKHFAEHNLVVNDTGQPFGG